MDTNEERSVDAETAEQVKTPGCYIKRRFVLAVMGFLVVFNVYANQSNLSVAIVAMVNATEDTGNGSNVCPDHRQAPQSNGNSNGVFDWNSAEQGLLLGCYFYGYTLTNIPGAWLAKKYGFKIVVGLTMAMSSVIILCTPAALYSNFKLAVALRILLGFCQGVSSPALQQAWSHWAPPLERSTLVGIVFSGSSFGACVAFPVAGVIADTLGWETVFYITGGFTLIWTVFWFAIIYNSPSEHPSISNEEKTYIIESIGLQSKKIETEKIRTPWKSMFTSLPLFGIICGHFASNWGTFTLLTMLPTYLATILKYDLTSSGGLSSLPYLLQWIVSICGGMMTDTFLKRRLTSTTAIRKINTTLGLGIPAIAIALAGYVGCNATAAIALLTISVALNSLTVPGCKANTLDIAPKYGGFLYGISNSVATVAGFLAPQVVGLILLNGNNLSQWQLVFWIAAAINVFGAVVYLIFGTANEQSWAKGKVIMKEIEKSNERFL